MTGQLRVMKIYVLQGSLEPNHSVWQGHLVPNRIEGDHPASTSPNHALDRTTTEVVKQEPVSRNAVSQDALLQKEMDEINTWARLGAQLYFGWFALQFTVNGLVMNWLFTHTGAMPPFAGLIFGALIGWNLMGTIACILIRKHMLDCDLRIEAVMQRLTQHHVTEDPGFRPRSPVPRQAINTVCVFTATPLLMLTFFWTVLFVMMR
jgi:hypothetical protein